uniref:Cytochrome b n=1 Tax=Demodex brevis TaxID=574145 RepID=A0A0A7DUB0_DEMBR|nr:cytochrome b [Demodex brevis]
MKNQIPMMNTIKNNFIILPTPSPISYSWNLGSMLGTVLSIQILTGFFISMHYSPSTSSAFNSYMEISRNLNEGFLLKFLHSTGASLFFILIYSHIFRALSNKSFKNTHTWMSGLSILAILMTTAFMGYVLPWGQMSLWGATVITNLLSTIPLIGTKMMYWLWGGFSVENPTLNRFFSIHFILPFILAFLSIIHMSLLHQMGSSSNLNINTDKDKITFKNFFSTKGSMSFILLITTIILLTSSFNLTLMDPENFVPANPLSTPNHIMPEWYFLFAYAILRSIPNKLGGVLALISSILILTILPLIKPKNSSKFNPLFKLKTFSKMTTFIILTFLGAQVIEEPFSILSKTFSTLYFLLILT